MSKYLNKADLENMIRRCRSELKAENYGTGIEFHTRDNMLLNFEQIVHLVEGIEIVHCKECKHWYNDADCGYACEFTNMSQPEDGYCNWGEKKNETT